MDSEKLQSQSFAVPGRNYGYTGIAIDDLQSWENTLALGLLDESGSTSPFKRQMEECVKAIVGSLQKHPRKDNLIYAHYHFDTDFREVHGWLPLDAIDLSKYDGCWAGGGQTALYDSTDRVINIVLDYAKRQAAKRYLCNGIIYTITDGADYIATPGNHLDQGDVKKTLASAITSEDLESLVTILIGVNPSPSVQAELEAYANNVGFTRYIPIEKADEKTLARVAGFVSQSVGHQSQALGQGGPSQQINSLTF